MDVLFVWMIGGCKRFTFGWFAMRVLEKVTSKKHRPRSKKVRFGTSKR